MKRIFVLLIGVGIMFITMSNSSCEKLPQQTTSSDIEQAQAEEILNEAMKQVGMPNIDKFTERKLLKMILELKDDENLICHAYFADEFHGSVGEYIGRCVGYGVPAATQFSNPEKIVIKRNIDMGQYEGDYILTMPQPEPNGLNMPTSTDATWLIVLDDKNKPRVCYIEQKIDVFPWKFK